MNKTNLNIRIASVLLMGTVLFTGVSCDDDESPMVVTPPNVVLAPDVNFTALTNTNNIVKYNARNLTSPTSTIAISGLQTDEKILSIDYTTSNRTIVRIRFY